MKKSDTMNHKQGQTLVTLLVFIVVAITITTSAALIILNSSINATKFEKGQVALYIAESGAENALIRLIRDPTYTGETLSVGQGTATVVVTGTTTRTITSTGTIGNSTRKIQVVAGYSNNILVVTPPWQEIP